MTPTRSYDVFIDGASKGNPGPAGVGVAFFDGQENPIRSFSKYIGHATNNVAEYLALIYALQEALQAGYTAVRVRTDSELLARQVTGQYKVRDAQLRVFHDLAVHLAKGFARYSIEHIPRSRNMVADRLANHAVRDRAI